MDSLNRLIEIFAHFPGIGPRQAKRFAYYLLSKPQTFIKEFTGLVEEIKKATSQCSQCQRLFIGKSAVCSVCSDKGRDQATLMVVARDSDFDSIEKSGAYKGLYFILGGTIPVLDKEPEKRIRLKGLLDRVSGAGLSAAPTFKEIILSLNTTPDGEHTADVVKEALMSMQKAAGSSAKISILGRGLSTGAELEYVDGETIKNALANRH